MKSETNAVSKTILTTICLVLLAAHQLCAQLYVGFNPGADNVAYIEYDSSTFNFIGSATVTTQLGGANGPITGLAFDSNGNLNIAIESSPGFSVIETWDVSTSTLLGSSDPRIAAEHLAPGLNSNLFQGFHHEILGTGFLQYDPATFDYVAGSEVNTGAVGPITGFAFDSNGNLNININFVGSFSRIETWNVLTGTLNGFSDPQDNASNLAPGPNGNVFVGLDSNGTFSGFLQYNPTTFDIVPGSNVQTDSTGPISGLAFDSNGNLNIAVESSPGLSVIETWDVSTNTLLGTSPPVAGLRGLANQVEPQAPEQVVSFGIIGTSATEALAVVTEQGHSATILTDLSASSLSGIDVVWALNGDNFSHLGALITDAASVSAFVNAGGVLMYHDRSVTDANTVLPGGGGITFTRDLLADANEINVINNSTLVTNGPGGIVDDTTLDDGNSSSHGFATAGSLPGSATSILGRTLASDVVDFRYEFGAGEVYYSSIPLDFYLTFGNVFREIYAPNVAAYSASLANPVSFGIIGTSTAEALAVVTAQGHSASILTDLSASSLPGIDVVWALNGDNFSHLGALITDAASVSAFVNAGGVLMYHDRFVTDANTVLPGGGGITFTRDLLADANEINVINNSTLVTNGPGGIVGDMTLDGGNSSSHGFATAGTLPGSATSILGRTLASDVVDFRYEFGAGEVYYSSIPLDFYLTFGNVFRDIYAPNVAAYSTSRIKVQVLLGDVNLDGVVNLLDVAPFVDRLSTGTFQAEADANGDGVVNLLDVAPFVALLSGG